MKKNIALVTGGFSGEAVISYKSALTIGNHLDKERFNVYTIDINPEGWYHTLPDGRRIEVDKNDFSLRIDKNKVKFDAVFVGMHGTPGEDGKLQGYFDTLRIPYTSCDAATSAITFNKRYTVAVAKMAGIAVANSVHLFRHLPVPVASVAAMVKLPVFVKPNNGGSSIGMSKVTKPEDLGAAIDKAFREDDQVLVEEMVQGREFTVGVFQTKAEIIVLPITEVKAHDEKDFFDFEAKYEGKSTETTPAEVDETIADKIRNAARKIYTVFNCRGVVRIDFIYEEKSG
ncbi:MAG TPA: D-alanine--D-alanine ligase family protein, partial [Chitinophagaceae bacterium]|nr:D-alanine--D-alanine ligase family protein [Chitinophagaceae bacterium]